MDYSRISVMKTRLERVNNKHIAHREKTVIENIQEMQLFWYVHINQMKDERQPKTVMKWRRKTTIKNMDRAMLQRNLQGGD